MIVIWITVPEQVMTNINCEIHFYEAVDEECIVFPLSSSFFSGGYAVKEGGHLLLHDYQKILIACTL